MAKHPNPAAFQAQFPWPSELKQAFEMLNDLVYPLMTRENLASQISQEDFDVVYTEQVREIVKSSFSSKDFPILDRNEAISCLMVVFGHIEEPEQAQMNGVGYLLELLNGSEIEYQNIHNDSFSSN